MCLIMACTSILFNPILEMIGWENKSDRLKNDRSCKVYFFLKASPSAINATTKAAMDRPRTRGEEEAEAVSDAFSSFGFSCPCESVTVLDATIFVIE